MREALASAIASEPGWIVAAQVAATSEALQLAVTLNPDTIMLAVGNPGLDDLYTLRALRQALPAMPIMALITDEVVNQAQAALEHGASCVTSKSTSRAELMNTLDALRGATVSA